MNTNFKVNDIVKLTASAIAENCRLFQKNALYRNEAGKKYRVTKVVDDNQNNLRMVFVVDMNGNSIEKFNCGIFAGHLELA